MAESTDKKMPMKIGIVASNHYTDWPRLREIGIWADAVGCDSLWASDHMLASAGDSAGPIFEGYLTLAAWAEKTENVRLGLMVGANTLRNPAVVAKMVTTLDHISHGRMYLGIGAGWFEEEHHAFGIEFGSGHGERADWLAESVELMRAMLRGGPASSSGGHYRVRAALNNPPPVQPRLPILIGAEGEQKNLKTVARYADAWNIRGGFGEWDSQFVKHKDAVLRRWCERVGRDPSEIERTLMAGTVIVRDTPDEARRIFGKMARQNIGWSSAAPDFAGPPELIAERWQPFADLGFRHICVFHPAPYDEETVERLSREVKPLLAT